jgi:hypothetical protein
MPDHFVPYGDNPTETDGDVTLAFTPSWNPGDFQFHTQPPGQEIHSEFCSLLSGTYQGGVATFEIQVATHHDAWMEWSDNQHILKLIFEWHSGHHDISYESTSY